MLNFFTALSKTAPLSLSAAYIADSGFLNSKIAIPLVFVLSSLNPYEPFYNDLSS